MKSKIPSAKPIRPKRKPQVLTKIGGARDPKNTTQMLPKIGVYIRREENLGFRQVHLFTVVTKILKHSSNSMAITDRSLRIRQEVISKE
jgi:hypothetical protein